MEKTQSYATAPYIENLDCMEFHRNSMRKHNQPKQYVYALFTQRQEKRSCEIRNSLILKVDQPGLEPGTSRL